MKKHVFMLLAGLAAGAVSAQTPVPYDFTAQNEPTNSIRTKSPEAPRPHSSALSFYTALKSNRPLSLPSADLPRTIRTVRTDREKSPAAADAAGQQNRSRWTISDHRLSVNVK